MSNFETWWEREGQEFLFALNTTTDDDIKLVAEVAWKNGAYCSEQAEQEPVGVIGWAANIPNTMEEVHWEDECPPIGTTLYAAPVRTKDLTDAFINELHKDAQDPISFARAVIQEFRRKNGIV